MSDKTLKQAAEILGYSKNAVKFQCKKLTDKELYQNEQGIYYITDDGIEKLHSMMGKKQKHNNHETTKQQPTNNNDVIEQLQIQIAELKADKEFLQSQLQQAANRADFLTIQTLPFFRRRKALKEYNKRQIEEKSSQ